MTQRSICLGILDNGGRRRIRDRRFLVSAACRQERRTNWERRCGFDRRLRRMVGPEPVRDVREAPVGAE